MLITRRAAVLAVCIWSPLQPTLTWAQTARRLPAEASSELRPLIAKASRLSVLSDRITRSQAQRSLGVLRNRAERVLIDSTAESKRLLNDLGNAALSSGTRPQFQLAAQGYLGLLTSNERFDTLDRVALAKLAIQADEVGEELDKLVALLIRDLGQPVATVLSTTADLQRLTQDLAVHFLLGRAGIDEKDQQKRIDAGREHFGQLLGDLRKSPIQTLTIGQQLQLLDNQWTLMRQALNLSSRDASAMENICSTSERTLEVLTQLYPQYEAAL